MVSGTGGNRRNKLALLIQYDGTNFNGWQIQKSGRTVQAEIERALQVYTKESISVFSSGRTDAGVHALGQVVHCEVSCDLDIKRLCSGLNGILPRDISVKNIYKVEYDFHARYSATSREYIYLVYNHKQRNPLMYHRAMWVNFELDFSFLKETVQYIIGEKDFASFCKKRSAEINTFRRIEKIDIYKHSNMLIFKFVGNAFLHNMIRIIIGTIIEMNRCGNEPNYITHIIEKKDRYYSGITAPSCGLYLYKIEYKPPLSSMESAF